MLTFDIEKELKRFFKKNFKELIIVCPFISLNGIEAVFKHINNLKHKKIIVVTRWRKLDIITGVSDLRVYTFLKKKHVKLFHHDKIHSKILLTDRKLCFFGSANITEAGLGIGSISNIELNGTAIIKKQEYLRVKKIIDESILIDDVFYSGMCKLKKDNIKLFNEVKKIKKKHKEKHDWEEFLGQAINKEEIINKWL